MPRPIISWGPLNLGDVKEAYEILANTQLIKFTESKSGVMFTARNLLISALSDYDSYQDIFWEVIESDFFHCETVGGKAVSPSDKVSKKCVTKSQKRLFNFADMSQIFIICRYFATRWEIYIRNWQLLALLTNKSNDK